MTAPRNAYAVPSTEMGVAIETTRGTFQVPVFWIKVRNPKYKPNLGLNEDATLQGSMVKTYDLIPQLRSDGHGWDSYPNLDSFPVFLRAILGSNDTLATAPTSTTLSSSALAGATTISTAASIAAGSWIVIGSGATIETHKTTAVSGAGPYTVTLMYGLAYPQASSTAVTGLTGHTFSLLNNAAATGNQPPSVSISDFDGEEWRAITAAQLSKLTIKGTATGLVEYTVEWIGYAATNPGVQTPSFTSTQALPGWTANVMLNTTELFDFVDWEFDLTRAVKAIPALTGTQQPYAFFAGPLEATGKITVIEGSGAPELSNYLAATQQAFDITVNDIKSGYALQLHSSKAQFKSGELLRNNNEWVEAQLDVQFLPTATDATAGGVSPVQVAVADGQTTTF